LPSLRTASIRGSDPRTPKRPADRRHLFNPVTGKRYHGINVLIPGMDISRLCRCSVTIIPNLFKATMNLPRTLETLHFVSVNDFDARISSRKCTQSFQARAAASGSRVIPALWSDSGLESPGEVARIAG